MDTTVISFRAQPDRLTAGRRIACLAGEGCVIICGRLNLFLCIS